MNKRDGTRVSDRCEMSRLMGENYQVWKPSHIKEEERRCTNPAQWRITMPGNHRKNVEEFETCSLCLLATIEMLVPQTYITVVITRI